MFMNLGPLAKGWHGVKRCSPQVVGRSQKRRHELIPGHCPQTLTTRIVSKLYPRDTKHIRNQLQCDRNAHTLNASEKERYWTINPVHVGVKLLDKHERTCNWDVTQWLPSPVVNDRGKVSVGKVRQNDLAFRMNASSGEVLQKCLKGNIITEPNSRRRRISKWRSIETKRVPGMSEFTFRCHRHD